MRSTIFLGFLLAALLVISSAFEWKRMKELTGSMNLNIIAEGDVVAMVDAGHVALGLRLTH
ncbi:hypothetical protein TorRG33x02_297430 [Trema orientale]|uniref:Uncharacterized protein n=1 Tax=Trema orientale TaxID=63057 RepID=A0A2P5C4Y2_TREOI|nr:hypothetical protein TorRG33x02_297430 [Trema orientale]